VGGDDGVEVLVDAFVALGNGVNVKVGVMVAVSVGVSAAGKEEHAVSKIHNGPRRIRRINIFFPFKINL